MFSVVEMIGFSSGNDYNKGDDKPAYFHKFYFLNGSFGDNGLFIIFFAPVYAHKIYFITPRLIYSI